MPTAEGNDEPTGAAARFGRLRKVPSLRRTAKKSAPLDLDLDLTAAARATVGIGAGVGSENGAYVGDLPEIGSAEGRTTERRDRADKRTLAELAELRKLVSREAYEAERARGDHLGGSRGWSITIAVLLVVAAALRIYGLKTGLPFAYNVDEQAHFLPRAIGMFGHGGDPDYFVNPPAYTYLVHVVLSVWFGGRNGVYQAWIDNSSNVWVVARLTTAATGVLGVWLIWRAGLRLLGRPAAFLGAGVMTFCFLAVFYSHQALNDVPTLAPIALSLWGSAGLLIGDSRRDWILAGVGLGLAIATKYTGGIVALPMLAAVLHRWRADGSGPVLAGMAWAALASGLAFLVANPYALLTPHDFYDDLVHQQAASAGDDSGKLGLTQTNGWEYYLITCGWGIGWIPSILSVVGAAQLFLRDRMRFWLLVPAPIVYILFMGSQVRFFGRWILPIAPMIALLSGVGALAIATFLLRSPVKARRPRILAVLFVILCAQGVVYSVHSTLELGRADTRTITRQWMFDHIPTGAKIVLEPIVPGNWITPIGKGHVGQYGGGQWVKYAVGKSRIDPKTGSFTADGQPVLVSVEDFERVLRPDLITKYRDGGFCLVIVGSTQRGRAENQPDVVPDALRYYKTLEENSHVIYRASPLKDPKAPVPFSFDWSFLWFPLSYERPGPEITIYRLFNNGDPNGKCGDGTGPLTNVVNQKAATEVAKTGSVKQPAGATGDDTDAQGITSGDPVSDAPTTP